MKIIKIYHIRGTDVVVVVVLPGCFRGMAASYVQKGHKRIILNTEVLLA